MYAWIQWIICWKFNRSVGFCDKINWSRGIYGNEDVPCHHYTLVSTVCSSYAHSWAASRRWLFEIQLPLPLSFFSSFFMVHFSHSGAKDSNAGESHSIQPVISVILLNLLNIKYALEYRRMTFSGRERRKLNIWVRESLTWHGYEGNGVYFIAKCTRWRSENWNKLEIGIENIQYEMHNNSTTILWGFVYSESQMKPSSNIVNSLWIM